MAQHDMNIANQLFPATRADVNDAFLALVTNNSGATPPASMFAYMLWADTSTNILKYRNATNDAWISLVNLTNGTLIQPLPIEANTIGMIAPWPGDTAPSKWLFCHGQVVSRTDYPGLFNVLGTRYNTGGETAAQFRLPDMRGRAVFGKDDMGGTAANRITTAGSGVNGLTLGATGGDQRLAQHAHNVNDPGHPHGITDPGHVHGIFGQVVDGSGPPGTSDPSAVPGSRFRLTTTDLRGTGVTVNSGTTGITVANAGVGTSENMPPAIVMNWIIFAGALGATGSGGTPLGPLESHILVCGGETALVTAAEVFRFRMPYKFVPSKVKASLRTAASTGTLTLTISVNGTPLFSTNLTIDATEKTSATAAVPAVLALATIADDAEVIVTVSNAADGTAAGLKVYLLGYHDQS